MGSKLAVVLSASSLLLFAANTAIIGAYHIFLALSNTGFLPRVIALRGERFNSPYIAIAIATGVPIAVVLATQGELALLGEMYAFGLLGAFCFFFAQSRCHSLAPRAGAILPFGSAFSQL